MSEFKIAMKTDNGTVLRVEERAGLLCIDVRNEAFETTLPSIVISENDLKRFGERVAEAIGHRFPPVGVCVCNHCKRARGEGGGEKTEQ